MLDPFNIHLCAFGHVYTDEYTAQCCLRRFIRKFGLVIAGIYNAYLKNAVSYPYISSYSYVIRWLLVKYRLIFLRVLKLSDEASGQDE